MAPPKRIPLVLSVVWIVVALAAAGVLAWFAVQLGPREFNADAGDVRVTFQLAQWNLISLPSEAKQGPTNLAGVRVAVAVTYAAIFLGVGAAIWFLARSEVWRWLDGPARASILGGYLLCLAGYLILRERFLPEDAEIHFFAGLLGILIAYGVLVINLAGIRDLVDGKSGVIATSLRWSIEAVAWLTGFVGLFGAAAALVVRLLAILVG